MDWLSAMGEGAIDFGGIGTIAEGITFGAEAADWASDWITDWSASDVEGWYYPSGGWSLVSSELPDAFNIADMDLTSGIDWSQFTLGSDLGEPAASLGDMQPGWSSYYEDPDLSLPSVPGATYSAGEEVGVPLESTPGAVYNATEGMTPEEFALIKAIESGQGLTGAAAASGFTKTVDAAKAAGVKLGPEAQQQYNDAKKVASGQSSSSSQFEKILMTTLSNIANVFSATAAKQAGVNVPLQNTGAAVTYKGTTAGAGVASSVTPTGASKGLSGLFSNPWVLIAGAFAFAMSSHPESQAAVHSHRKGAS